MEILEIITEALAVFGGDKKGFVHSISLNKECGTIYVRLFNGNTFLIRAEMTGIQSLPVDIDSGEEISSEEWNKKFGKKYGFVI